jgi:hypothetical protein
MVTLPLVTCARLLGIHPKTLRHWLKAAALPLAAHPTDARLKCVAEEHLLELAKQHGRPLPALSSVPTLERSATSSLTGEQAKPLPAHEGEPAHRAAPLAAASAAHADLLQQLAHLQTQLATLQHQLAGLALDLLQEPTGRSEHRLRPLQGRLSQPLESFQVPQQTDVASPLLPSVACCLWRCEHGPA